MKEIESCIIGYTSKPYTILYSKVIYFMLIYKLVLYINNTVGAY